MTNNLLIAAFIGGLASFLAPCVLPLIPGFLAYLAGADVVNTADGHSLVKIKEARLYKIINSDVAGAHTLKFIMPQPGLKIFTFTFG